MIADRYFVRVSAEILDGLVRSTKGGFGVDDPVLLACCGEVASEICLFVEVDELAVEAQFGFGELFEKEPAEESRQDTNAEKEVLATAHPSLLSGVDATAGDDAVHMRMMHQVLAPGVQDREEADAGTQVSGVAGNGEQCFGTGIEQDVIDGLFVLQRQLGDCRRQCEDEVIVSGWQQFSFPPLKPLLAGQGLALRAVAVAAGVVGDALMLAVTASFDMTAEGGGTANLYGMHRLELLKGERMLVTVRPAVLTEDAGQLEAGPGHASGFALFRAAWFADIRQCVQW